ncbi:UNVERIFIED_CONTAM: hypothetical protein Sangu_0987400 [Sesamum angustifolium]|uniref:Uncharacterized protein n=1 Tax=Sesamum angustifolium TaxID=2727405 RepID=A0AAW2PF19_9LAMI
MASKQLRRENHVTDERKTVVKKDRVPKMTTHFESLAGKARDEQHNAPVHGEKPHQFETPPVGVQVSGSGRNESQRMRREEGLEEETETENRASISCWKRRKRAAGCCLWRKKGRNW